MKALFTVSGVVFAHICVFLLLVNGCRGNGSSQPNQWSDTSIYSGGASAPAAAQPAKAAPAKSVPAQAQPSEAQPASAVPAGEEKPVASEPQKSAPAAPANSEEAKLHTVKKGEMLSTIAVRHGLTAKELAAANGIALNSTLRIGQVLKIPAAKPKAASAQPAAEGEIYVVQKGDILGNIARKFKVSVKQIKEANNLKNDNIRIGQKLVIPSKNAKKVATEEKPAAAPANAENKPAESEKPAEEKTVPAEQPTEKSAAPAEPAKKVEPEKKSGDDLGVPEGGFGGFGFKDEKAVPANGENAPEEGAPASATPAE